MNLVVSTIGVDSGLLWETNLNADLSLIDQHNHSPGYGVQINPAGININADFPINNHALTSVGSSVFQQQTSLATLNALFVGTDGNLYFNDGAGDPSIKITAGGVVNATASGIASGTATASFVSSVLVVNAAVNTPANIQAGSILLGNNVVGSKFLTLSPPAAMAANYTLTLPALPIVTSIMTLDPAGNMVAGNVVDNSTIQFVSGILSVKNSGITSAKIASSAVGTAQLVDHSVTQIKKAIRPDGLSIQTTLGGIAQAGLSLLNYSGAAFASAGSCTLTTSGNPIVLSITAIPGTVAQFYFSSLVNNAVANYMQYRIVANNGSDVECGRYTVHTPAVNLTTLQYQDIFRDVTPGTLCIRGFTADVWTFRFELLVNQAGNSANIDNWLISAYEL